MTNQSKADQAQPVKKPSEGADEVAKTTAGATTTATGAETAITAKGRAGVSVGKILLFTLYFLLVAVVSGKLFFEKSFDSLMSRALQIGRMWTQETQESLTIGYSEPPISLNPLANDTGSRARLLHIYEPLVRVNPDLQIEPAIAISYGALDDLTWEFRIRPGVFFHNGSRLSVDDVVFSLNQAKTASNSDVSDLTSTISEIKKIDEETIYISTNSPDPLLLSKLSSLLIFPENNSEAGPVEAGQVGSGPIGSGPYYLVKSQNGTLDLERFEKYWDPTAAQFKNIQLKTFSSKFDKLTALSDGTVDIVANVPPDTAKQFAFPKFKLETQPSLEVNFLMFNFDGVFRTKALREAVAKTLDIEKLAQLVHGFATPATQFVGNGIFGYDTDIPLRKPDSGVAKSLVEEGSAFSPPVATLDLPTGLEVFGANIKEQLDSVGFELKLNFLSPADLGKKITEQNSEFYFFGWRTDLGDASDFLTGVVHSRSGSFGQFNGANYNDSEVDSAIETSQKIIVSETRLEHLRDVMKKITVDDIIGIPLFSPDILYGVSTDISWKPRVDGYILAQEVKM